MKTALVSILFVFCVQLLPAQVYSKMVKITFDEEEEKSKEKKPKGIKVKGDRIGSESVGDFFEIFYLNGDELQILQTDTATDEEKLFIVEYSPYEKGVDFKIDEIVEFNGRYWFLTKVKSKKDLRFYYHIQEFDFEIHQFIGEKQEFVSFNFLRSGRMEVVYISPKDSSDVALITFIDAVVNDERVITDYIFKAQIRDEDWNIIDEHAETVSKENKRWIQTEYKLIDNNELLAYQIYGKKDLIDEDDIYFSGVGKDFRNNDYPIIYKLLTEGLELEMDRIIYMKFTTHESLMTSAIKIDQDEFIETVGFYTAEDDTSITGIGFERMNLATKKVEVKYTPFELEKDLSPKKYYKPESLQFAGGHIVEHDDGFFLIATKSHSERGRFRQGGEMVWGTYAVAEGIYVYSIDKEGELLWETKIDYLAYTGGAYSYLGNYSYMLYEGYLYFFYDGFNAETDFEKEVKEAKLVSPKEQRLTVAVIDDEGNVRKEQLTQDLDSKYNKLYVVRALKEEAGFRIAYDDPKNDFSALDQKGYLIFGE